MQISKELITDIKSSVNIVDVIGEVVALSKAGRNHLGLCPFHKEKTPSFNVSEENQLFRCFGCQKSGDVISFIEEYRGLTFADSVQELAQRAGVTIEVSSQVKPQESPYQSLYDINADALRFYKALLMTTKEGHEAREYLYQRGLTDDLIQHFDIGLSPNQPDYLYRNLSQKYDEDALMSVGLFNLNDETNRVFDSFRNRIMFALKDEYGRVIGFSGRIWTEEQSQNKEAKYKNTRSTVIFNKSYEFYYLDKAKPLIKKQREVYLMEGFMDVIAAYRSGIENAVASMGTALTPEHVEHLRRFTKRVVLTYDGDRAGQEATRKALELLREFEVDIVTLPNQLDPDEFIKSYSENGLANYLKESRTSDVEFYIQYYLPKNSDNLQARIAYVDQIAGIIAKVKSITAQNTYIARVADMLPDYSFDIVERAVNEKRLVLRQARGQYAGVEGFLSQKDTVTFAKEMPLAKQESAFLRIEFRLLQRLMTFPHLLNQYRLKTDFVFYDKRLQSLFNLLKEEGEIDRLSLEQLSQEIQDVYYKMLEERLPQDLADGEIEELESRRERLLGLQELKQQESRIKEYSNGSSEHLVSELEALIAQRRRLE